MQQLSVLFQITPGAQVADFDPSVSALNALIFLVVIALLGAAAVRLMRARRGAPADNSALAQFEVCSTKALSARSRLVTVRFNHQILLLGVTDQSVTTLASRAESEPSQSEDLKGVL